MTAIGTTMSLMLIASGSVAIGAMIGLRGPICGCALVIATAGAWVLS